MAAKAQIQDERALWLHFVDGLVVDPRRCPKGVAAYHHWRLDPAADAAPGEPNAVCAHTHPELADVDATAG